MRTEERAVGETDELEHSILAYASENPTCMVTLKVNQNLIISIQSVAWRDAFVQCEQARGTVIRLALCRHVL